MKHIFIIACSLLGFFPGFSQEEKADSVKVMDSVVVHAYEITTSIKTVPIGTCAISVPNDISPKTSLVNGMNQVSGVRMEERSPGSYRLNIRGSSLRSPFGVRNVKVYWHDIPISDPGGNTYFNQFASNNFSDIIIAKGPVGSMYGAGTGGVVLLHTFSYRDRWKNGTDFEYITGSYNLHNVFASGRFGRSKNQVTYAHNQSDGYRDQTRLRKDNFTWYSQYERDLLKLTAVVLFTDMYYQTPGALTKAEFDANPKAARPAAGGFPSAVNAKAAIYQKNILAGFSNQVRISGRVSNTTVFYGNFAQVKNPAIRNYERRNEPSFGSRNFFRVNPYIGRNKLDLVAGAEFQQGYFNTMVSKNKNGNPDTLMTNDDINNNTFTIFGQAMFELPNYEHYNPWTFIAGVGVTQSKIGISRLNVYPVVDQRRIYKSELAPKFSIMKNFNYDIYWTASIAKGFSPPTTAEVLPSTGVISTFLEAEHGWNYETGFRFYLLHNKLSLELSGFSFRLDDALVQRRDSSGADFFVNAGSTKQNGIEFRSEYKRSLMARFFEDIFLRMDFSYSDFRYGSFVKGSDDFSGKRLPSVPKTTLSFWADLHTKPGLYLRLSYYGASTIFLNDGNTAKSDPYHLAGCQLGWKKKTSGPYRLNIFAGVDNLLDENYSQGNDINAAANRFYNAAPRRNYYMGISFQWISSRKN